MLKKVLNRSPEAAAPATAPSAPADAGGPESVLQSVSEQLRQAKGELSVFGARLGRALDQSDWALATKTLLDLVESGAELSNRLPVVRREPVEAPAVIGAASVEAEWKRAAASLLENGIPALLPADDAMAVQARLSARQLRETDAGPGLQCLHDFIDDCGGHGDMAQRRQALLLEVLRQLIGNVAVLSEKASWGHGQVATVETLLGGPLSLELLEAAIANLKDVSSRQGVVRDSRDQARDSVERMLHTFSANLDAVTSATGHYQARIGNFTSRLTSVETPEQLQTMLAGVAQETATVEAQARAATEQVIAARAELHEVQGRIQALEAELEQMSELARVDPLTRSLNRRGMLEALSREMQRAQRYRNPLCIAMLDIDNFKQLNDRLGHQAGDGALVHVVSVIKATLRQMDVIARFGGEEFLLLLPNAGLADALQTVTRIQRELTRSIFMHEHQRVLVTFSAGAALVAADESEDRLIRRVDAALYRAKREGKNRVVAAD